MGEAELQVGGRMTPVRIRIVDDLIGLLPEMLEKKKSKSTRVPRRAEKKGIRGRRTSPSSGATPTQVSVKGGSPGKQKAGSIARTSFQQFPHALACLEGELISAANSAFKRLLGLRSGEEVVGTSILHCASAASRKLLSLTLKRLPVDTSYHRRLELTFERPDGKVVFADVTIQVRGEGNHRYTLVTIMDIHERSLWRDRAEKSEQLFRNVVDSMADALIITDLQGHVLDVNSEFARITGYTRDDALQSAIPYPWLDDDDLRSSIGWLERLRGMNELRDFDMVWRSKQGKRIAVSLNTTLLYSADGKPRVMINIARDITERQRSREALSAELRKTAILFELSRSLGATLDLDEIGRATFNQVARVVDLDVFSLELYNEGERRLGQVYSVDTSDGDRKESPPRKERIPIESVGAIRKAIELRKPIMQRPRRSRRRGSARSDSHDATSLCVPMFSKDRVIGVLFAKAQDGKAYERSQIALVESIANVAAIALEKGLLHREIVTKSQEIEARNRELDDFSYVVSHDLREPIVSAEGFARILSQELGDRIGEREREYVRSMLDSCQHMKELIDDLLQLTRVSRASDTKKTISLSDVIDQILDEVKFIIRQRNVKIRVQRNLPYVIGVEPHLKIVFRNLVSNAIKFCDKPNPAIEIGATEDVDHVRIRVSDNGMGISAEHSERVFVIFQRLHPADKYEGTGAGLAIVRKIVEAHGGKIWLNSEVGNGTTFYFTLPKP